MTSLTFFGATGTVTGSRFMLEINRKKLLIGCGLFQGAKKNRLRNWEPFPVPPAEIDAVFLTHAHIDHTGYLPRFCKDGFAGKVYCTYPTYDLCEILLPDSAHLQEEDAEWANRKGFSRHKPALPLYTVDDARNALTFFSPVHYGDNIHLDENLRVKYRDAGHILGSGYVDIKNNSKSGRRKILFSGDLGRPRRHVLRDPSQPFNIDYLVLESTYGNRLHEDNSPDEQLASIINESIDRGGVLLIPSFAVGRTQTLLYVIRDLEEQKKIPSIPVFIDSPMAIDATGIFRNRIADMNLIIRMLTLEGKKVFHPKRLQICKTRSQSKSINKFQNRAIIISASGMATGGRILHHLKERLPNERNTLLFIGYQAEGTRGRSILEGQTEVKIHGEYVPVKAHVENISGYSGHADYQEILAWLMGFNAPPKKTFLVHGEPDAAQSLKEKIEKHFGWDVIIPKLGDRFELEV